MTSEFDRIIMGTKVGRAAQRRSLPWVCPRELSVEHDDIVTVSDEIHVVNVSVPVLGAAAGGL